MLNFIQYVRVHTLRKITVGKSGAEVYLLDGGRVAKHVCRSVLQNDERWTTYRREAMLYACPAAKGQAFLPEVYHCSYDDNEIQLIMKQYRPLAFSQLDDGLLYKVLSVLADIHRLTPPDFLPQQKPSPVCLPAEDIVAYLSGWRSIVERHGDAFSPAVLYAIAEKINEVNTRLFSAKQWLCHGDFHFENLLQDDVGNIIVCDWQNVGLGHVSGDLSFFLSRLSAEGQNIPKEKVIAAYCTLSDTGVTPDEITVQMALANLNTSFMFWHNYLHSASRERVGEIFHKMAADMAFCLQYAGLQG